MKVAGFKAAAMAAELRYTGRPDLGLIIASGPVAAAGVFTKNIVCAAPVQWSKDKISNGRAMAVLLNAGRANACTGEQGLADAARSAKAVSEAVGCDESDVLLASTGVIGQPLNIEKLEKSTPALAENLGEENLEDVARAIMTTDTFHKIVSSEGLIEGKPFTVVGMAKGSGMIAPNMATMLSVVLTDAAVDAAWLQSVLSNAAEMTFNRITVDSDTSTNDTVIALASGAAGNGTLDGEDSSGAAEFKKAFYEVMTELARMVAADGEGATKLVKICVNNAKDESQAKAAAMTVANSPLVKTALFGEDANWGRIICALGRSGAEFDQNKVDIAVDDAYLARQGLAAGNEAAAAEVMKKKEYSINIDLDAGSGSAEVLTCDFSYDYVKINADYRS